MSGAPAVRPIHATVVAASSPVPADRLEAGLEVVAGWGWSVDETGHVRARDRVVQHRVGDPREVARELTRAWLDPRTDVLLMARGGYGASAVLMHLDAAELASGRGKVLVGFSDVTALLHWFAAHGLRGIHGPNVTGLADSATDADAVRRLVEQGGGHDVLARSLEPVNRRARADLDGGVRVAGRLTGGNVAVWAAQVGTGALYSPPGGIAVIEDVDENPGRVARAMTQLRRVGALDSVGAVVLGDFVRCGPAEQLRAAVVHALPDELPVWAGAPVGHGERNRPFPFGVTARLVGGRLDWEIGPDGGWC